MKALYFLNKKGLLGEGLNTPIVPKKSDWYEEVNPTRLIKSFDFESYEQASFFVSALMRFANKIDHHPQITISNTGSVLVETYTQALNDITEQDIRITKMANQIFRDAMFAIPTPAEEVADDSNDERLTEGYHFDWTTGW